MAGVRAPSASREWVGPSTARSGPVLRRASPAGVRARVCARCWSILPKRLTPGRTEKFPRRRRASLQDHAVLEALAALQGDEGAAVHAGEPAVDDDDQAQAAFELRAGDVVLDRGCSRQPHWGEPGTSSQGRAMMQAFWERVVAHIDLHHNAPCVTQEIDVTQLRKWRPPKTNIGERPADDKQDTKISCVATEGQTLEIYQQHCTADMALF